MKLEDGEYWIYLRKSRADLEAEARGEGETLSKHRKALYKLAKEHKITVTRVYQEVVSGESILHRPEMVTMLREMENNPPQGILVMDIDRLGRGDKIDQGIIERTFKETRTVIVTPGEVYDLNQESGEFNVEVRSFLARLELKQTNKRLQGGRTRSVEDYLNYIGTRPPYGYNILKDEIGRTLVPNPEQAPVVKLIFELYTHSDPEKRIGSNKIANLLNTLKKPSYAGKPWESTTILNIIKNEVYFGRLQWGKKEQKKSKTPGKRRDTRTRPRSEWIDVLGRHEPLITEDVFQKAAEILKRKYHVPYHLENGITNPLAGLIRCGFCGASMVYRPYTKSPAHLVCYNQTCVNKSTRFVFVEEHLVDALVNWLKGYKGQWEARKTKVSQLPEHVEDLSVQAFKQLAKDLNELENQKGRLHDLLERGVYDEETFLSRSQDIGERIQATKISMSRLESEIGLTAAKKSVLDDFIPQVESAIELYLQTDVAAEKNAILKTVLEHAVYTKQKWQRNNDFSLTLFPRLPG